MIRATCPVCKKYLCMRHSGDGEWICESRKSKFCGEVYSEDIIPINEIIEINENE